MTGGRQTWTVRVAVWSARHRWPVAGLWLVLTIGLFVASLAMGGTRSADAVDDNGDETSTYESIRARELFGASGAVDPTHRTRIVVGIPEPLGTPATDWWLPGSLRWLPEVTIEGDVDEVPDGSADGASTIVERA